MRTRAMLISAVFVLAAIAVLAAQAPAAKWTELQRHDLAEVCPSPPPSLS